MDELKNQAAAPYTWPHFIMQERIYRMGITLNLVDKFSAVVKKLGHMAHVCMPDGAGFRSALAAAELAGKSIIVIGHKGIMTAMAKSDYEQAMERFDKSAMSESFNDRIKELSIELGKMEFERHMVIDDVVIQNKTEQKVIRNIQLHQKPKKQVNYKNKYNAHKQQRLIVRRR